MGDGDIQVMSIEEGLFLRDVSGRLEQGMALMAAKRWADLADFWADLEGSPMFDVGFANWADMARARRAVLMGELQILVARMQLAASDFHRQLGPAVDLLASITRQGAFAPGEFDDPRIAEVANANYLDVLRVADEWAEVHWGASLLADLGRRDETVVAQVLAATAHRRRELEHAAHAR